MPIAVTTAAIIQSRSGTGWTLDTTLANLDADILLKDFVVLFGTVVQSNTLFTKVSAVSVRYDGTSIGTTTVQLRRRTPIDPIKEVLYGERFSSTDWNREINRTSRRAAEYESFGIGSIGDVTGVPNNTVYGVSWATDTIFAPTRQAVYNKIEAAVADYIARDATITASIAGFAPLASPAFTGTPTAPSPATTANTAQIQTAAGVRSLLTSAADLKAFQNATYPTAAKTTNTTELASTAFAHLASVSKRTTFAEDITARLHVANAFVQNVATGTITPRSATSSFLIIGVACTTDIPATSGVLTRLRLGAGTVLALSVPFALYGTQHNTHTMVHVYTPGSASAFTLVLESGNHQNSVVCNTNGQSWAHGGSTFIGRSTLTVIEFENIL